MGGSGDPPKLAGRGQAQGPRAPAAAARLPAGSRARGRSALRLFPRPAGPPPGRDGAVPARSPRPADPAALPSQAAAPACRARPPPCRARSSSRCRTSTTCCRTAAAATACRASLATRSPPGSTWATRESPLGRPAHPKAGVGALRALGGGCGAWPPSGSPAGPGRGWSRRPPPRSGAEGLDPAPAPRVLPPRGARVPGRPARSRQPLGAWPWAGSGYRDHLTGGPLSPGRSPARASCDICLVLQ